MTAPSSRNAQPSAHRGDSVPAGLRRGRPGRDANYVGRHRGDCDEGVTFRDCTSLACRHNVTRLTHK